jgi:hypothetical protein
LAVSLNGYLDIEEVTSGLDHYIAPPGLGSRAGPLGALAVAADTHAERMVSKLPPPEHPARPGRS